MWFGFPEETVTLVLRSPVAATIAAEDVVKNCLLSSSCAAISSAGGSKMGMW